MTTSTTTTLLLFVAITVALQSSSTPTSSLLAFPLPPPLKNNPWRTFKDLTGCRHGLNRTGLANLKDYLHHFGYLPPPPPSNFSDTFDDSLEAALKTYQHNFGLNATGQLDEATVDQLMSPRCGVADVINGTSSMKSLHRGRGLYAFFPGNPTWPSSKSRLTYAFTSTSAVSINETVLRAVFSRAFGRWSAATTITFAEADTSDESDITIGFYTGAHGDGEPFDGELGTLAHAFSPTDGRFHLDAAEAWVAEGDVADASSDVAVDLESVAVHEIGHLLGLGHSSVEEAIMYPTIRTKTRKVELSSDDVDGIVSLYGSNPTYRGPAPGEATMSNEEKNDGGVGEVMRSVWREGISWVLAFVAIIGLL